jgi:2-aminoadipate transaminase
MTLAADVDTEALVEPAVAKGVAFIPGKPFFVDDSGRNTVRLTFAKESEERIRRGVEILRPVLSP